MTKKQIGKRFLQILIVLFGISFLTFGLTYLSPGDPAEIMLTECGNLPTPELLEQTRHELGLDQPFLVQYGTWLKGVLTGDMGQSYSFKMPVVQKLVSGFWSTLKMSQLALLMMIVMSVPSFWLGLILLSIFGVQLRWVNVAASSGLCNRCTYERYQGECDFMETCSSKCNASAGNSAWTFPGKSSWRYCSR